jgi:hypothetical protein
MPQSGRAGGFAAVDDVPSYGTEQRVDKTALEVGNGTSLASPLYQIAQWVLGAMGSRAEQYRAQAAQCETAAAAAHDPKIKTTYADLAKQWRDLARQVDTLERKPPRQ